MCRIDWRKSASSFLPLLLGKLLMGEIIEFFGLCWCFLKEMVGLFFCLFLELPSKNVGHILWSMPSWRPCENSGLRGTRGSTMRRQLAFTSFGLYQTLCIHIVFFSRSFCNYDLVHILTNWESFLWPFGLTRIIHLPFLPTFSQPIYYLFLVRK